MQADPVVEVKGMRIWIQPLPADIYHLDHDMTLNDFLDLIGILNDPSKQAIYTNPLTGATYILNIFDGNMPLTEVLDLIGYDRTNLEQQFLGNAHRIQIIDTTALSQLQADISNLFNPIAREAIFYRNSISDSQRSYFSEKFLKLSQIQQSEIENTFNKVIYEIVYNTLLNSLPTDMEFTLEEWKQKVDDKAKQEGQITEEFRNIVDLCLKEVILLNLIELSGAKELDINEIFNSLDNYLENNLDALIEKLSDPKNFALLLAEVKIQIVENLIQDGFKEFSFLTQIYFNIIDFKSKISNLGNNIAPDFNYKNVLNELNKPMNQNVIKMLIHFINRVRTLIDYSNLIPNNLKFIPIQAKMLYSLGPDAIYNMKYYKELLKDLAFTKTKLEKISHFSVDTKENLIGNPHNIQLKTFYKTILEQLRSTIDELSQKPKYSFLKEYAEFIENALISEQGRIKKEEFDVIKILDEICLKLFGLGGFTLLQLGIMNFDIDNSNNYIVGFGLTKPEFLLESIKEFGIYSFSGIEKMDSSDLANGVSISTLLLSFLLSGHKKMIDVYSENGKLIDKRGINNYAYNSFISTLFKNYQANNPSSKYHFQILNAFKNFFKEKIPYEAFYLEELSFEYQLDNFFRKKEILGNILTAERSDTTIKYSTRKDNGDYEFRDAFILPEMDNLKSGVIKMLAINDQDELNYNEMKVADIIEDKFGYDPENPDTRTELIKEIKRQLKIDSDNIAFMIFETEINHVKHKGFVVADVGMQFLPGTYYFRDQNGNIHININPNSKINHIYAASYIGSNWAWMHSERKLLLVLRVLFDINNAENIDITLISENPFCNSCLKMIQIFHNEFKDVLIEKLDETTDFLIKFQKKL